MLSSAPGRLSKRRLRRAPKLVIPAEEPPVEVVFALKESRRGTTTNHACQSIGERIGSSAKRAEYPRALGHRSQLGKPKSIGPA